MQVPLSTSTENPCTTAVLNTCAREQAKNEVMSVNCESKKEKKREDVISKN